MNLIRKLWKLTQKESKIIVSDVGSLDEIVENEYSGLKSHVKNKKTNDSFLQKICLKKSVDF